MSINIKNLTKHYGSVTALDNIALSISPGIHGLLGPNGAGKTTLMRILATILGSYTGDIAWGDIRWTHPMAVKRHLGYLPQHFGMYKFLRVKEALKGVALLKDIPKEREDVEINLAMERANLLAYADRKVGQLSGGMLRRLGIAQAMLGSPKLLIMDEPSVGLDPEERINLRKIIRDYADQEHIVLISSHIVNDIESLCDEVTIMNNGKILVSGSTQTVQSLADNIVCEEIISMEALQSLEKTNAIISFAPSGDGYTVRYLLNEPAQNHPNESPESPTNPVKATLEDSYTYIIKKN